MRLGVDLLCLSDLDRLVRRRWFARYAFAEAELAQARALGGARRREFLAGRFAAKEAVLKVLGTGLFQGVAPRDIAVLRTGPGAPEVTLCGGARPAARAAGITHLTVSITHKRDLIVAVAAGW